MDKASASGAEDSRFESWVGRVPAFALHGPGKGDWAKGDGRMPAKGVMYSFLYIAGMKQTFEKLLRKTLFTTHILILEVRLARGQNLKLAWEDAWNHTRIKLTVK